MRFGRAFLVGLICWMGVATAQNPPLGASLDEVRAHVQSLQRRIEDRTLELPIRERLALEAAATLDRAAQSSPTAEARRERWNEAVALLDAFRQANPGHPLARQFEVQAAVYVWAKARASVDPARVVLADKAARDRASADLDAAIQRFRPAVSALVGSDEALAQNARFRLAQALADLAEVGTADPATRRSRLEDALAVIQKPPTEPSLLGYGLLLRASLLNRLGRYTEAKTDGDAAAAATPPPPEADQIDVRVDLLLGLKQVDPARKVVDASRLDPASKLALHVRIDLEDLRQHSSGAERDAAESALFGHLKALRETKRPESRLSLVTAASAVREPGARRNATAWDLLADGALGLGDPGRAGALALRGADVAETAGDARTAAELRLKAGAAFFQAGRFTEADAPLTRVAEDAKAGDLRPRASMLRAISRGRWLAEKQPGASAAAYTAALRYQIETFPQDPSTVEARWLLGKLRLAESDLPGARALWQAIPHGTPRWLDSRLELVRVDQKELDARSAGGEPDVLARQMDAARAFLDSCMKEARGELETNPLTLARARLELMPGSGRPEIARLSAETVLRSLSRPSEREEARGLLLIALALQSRFVEAEQMARQEAVALDADPSVRLEVLRLLDRAAVGADSDLKMRRLGLLMTILLQRMSERFQAGPESSRSELKLREVRALLFSGNDVGARRALFGWSTSSLSNRPDLLADLADTYTRLDAFDLAVSVHRLRARSLAPGSLPWLDARYGLALAYFRTGNAHEALALIDATAILHPDLGGGELKNRFLRLRQRIQMNP